MAEDPLKIARMRALAESGEARRIRQRARLGLTEVAGACGVDQSTVYRWETGRRRPRGAAAARYAHLLEALEAIAS